MTDDGDDKGVLEFELFYSKLESEFFTGCGATFSCNESETSSTLSSGTENILINI